MRIHAAICAFLLASGVAPLYGQAAHDLRLHPDNITIWGAQSSQHFLVLVQQAGLERDVTSSARFSVSPAEVGEIDKSGLFTPKANGPATITAEFQGKIAKAGVRVEAVDKQRPFSFAHDIASILTKRGCNNTDCHGSVKGRGGFKLSMNAQFPRQDYTFIVEGGTFHVLTPDVEPKVARININEPEKSLVLRKPTFQVAHGGGLRFKTGSADYETILKWIRAGAPYGENSPESETTVERVDVFPHQVVLETGARQQLLVTAHHSNGHREDITDQARYIVNDEGIAWADENGVIEAKKPGETAVIIRAAGRAASVQVGVIEKPIADYPKLEARNYIDEFVFAKLHKFQIVPSELSDDSEFLRRICLDLTGTLPPPVRVREFMADKNPRKREELIERLLNSPEYVDFWSFRFGDLLRVTYNTVQDLRMTKAYEDWIVESIASNKPYDQMARERIAAQGNAAAARNFYYIAEIQRPEVTMPELVRVFWGRRMECAQCHDHPFESWSQNEFWGLAAFFGGLAELRDSRLVIDVLGGGHVDQPKDMIPVHPRTKQQVFPTFLDGTKLPPARWMDPRMEFARSLTAHPYFAEAAVNRMWSYLFGTGIVEPSDDFRSTNPPSNRELLEALAKHFRESGYDLKQLLKTIVRSRTYQLSAEPNESNRQDHMNSSHAQVRPLEAAVLLDAISTATGVPEEFKYHAATRGGQPPPGARAVEMLPEFTPSQFLDAFGRSMHTALPVGHPQPNLPQALHMLAGPTYTSKISKDGGRLDRLLKSAVPDAEIIDEFYLAALTRFPSREEKSELLHFIAQRPSHRAETLERVVWALIGSREFSCNH